MLFVRARLRKDYPSLLPVKARERSKQFRMFKDTKEIIKSFSTQEWLEEWGEVYGITSLQHLHRCCGGAKIKIDKDTSYKCQLPEGWIAFKVKIKGLPGNGVWRIKSTEGVLPDKTTEMARLLSKDSYSPEDWLAVWGKKYKLTNLVYLIRCCAGVALKISKKGKENEYTHTHSLPKGWVAYKITEGISGNGIWRLERDGTPLPPISELPKNAERQRKATERLQQATALRKEGKKLAEIAEILGITESGVSRLFARKEKKKAQKREVEKSSNKETIAKKDTKKVKASSKKDKL